MLPVALLGLIATAVVMCFGSPVVDLDSFARAGSRCSAGMTVNHFAHTPAGLERIEHRTVDMIAAVASCWTSSNATVSEKPSQRKQVGGKRDREVKAHDKLDDA